jgi:hypothetical protein
MRRGICETVGHGTRICGVPIGAGMIDPASRIVEQIGRAIANADGADFDLDPARFRRLASAALKPLTRPTEAMIDAAYQSVRFDEAWAINSRADFRKAVRAMVRSAMDE